MSVPALSIIIFLLVSIPTVGPEKVTEATINDILSDPEKYDGEYIGFTVLVPGTIKSLSPQNLVLEDEGETVRISSIGFFLFDGMKVGDRVAVIGEFHRQKVGGHHIEPHAVMYYPEVNLGLVDLNPIAKEPVKYNGKYVTVQGNITSISERLGINRIYLADEGGEAVTSVRIEYVGRLNVNQGERVNVSGLFNGGVVHADSIEEIKKPLRMPGFTVTLTISLVYVLFIFWNGAERIR